MMDFIASMLVIVILLGVAGMAVSMAWLMIEAAIEIRDDRLERRKDTAS